MTDSEFKDHPAIGWLNRLANIIADISSLMACLVLLWLVALTCVDVIGRYFFNSPVTGATELVQISMASPPYSHLKLVHACKQFMISKPSFFIQPSTELDLCTYSVLTMIIKIDLNNLSIPLHAPSNSPPLIPTNLPAPVPLGPS